MGDEDRWEKVRAIVRQECERIEKNILAVIEKHSETSSIKLVDGAWEGITKSHRDAWGRAFGSVNLDAELAKAAVWLMANPKRNPKNYSAFLYKWFSKPQQSSSIRSIPTQSEKPRICAYCGSQAAASVNGYWHCREHAEAAMEGRRPMQAVK